MERHVDAGNLDVGPSAAGDLASAFDLGLQRVQTAHGPGDGVLRTAQVVVDDLQELTAALGDLGDEGGDVVMFEVDLGRPDGGQPVVRPAQLVPRDEFVHLATAVEHHLEQRLEFENPCHTGQCGVLAHRVTAGDGTLDESALLAHLGHLRGSHRGHRDLRELRQVEHPVGMLVVHPAGDQAGRVVAHHVQHREAQHVTSELVGAFPDLARGPGARAHLHAHALVLDALAGEGVRRLRRGQPRGRRHHQLAGDFGRDLQDLRAQVDADPVHPDVDLVARKDHAQEAGGPADQLRRWDGLAVSGGDHVLGGRREPHAVHDGSVEARQQCRGPVGVDRVVIAGDHREGPHVDGRGDSDVAAAAARGVGGVAGDRSPGPDRVGEFGRAGAAADREAFLEDRQHGAADVADVDGDRNHPADLGVDRDRRRRGDDQLGGPVRQRLEQPGGVVQVDQAEQTLDDREPGVGDGSADRCEHRRPAPPDQGVGHRGQGRRQRGAEGGGDTGVVGHRLGIPVHGDRGGAVDGFGQRLGAVGAGGDRQHRTHGRGGVGGDHDRRTAVGDGRRQGEGDVDPGTGQRNPKHDPVGTDDLQSRTGGMVCGTDILPGRRAPALRTAVVDLPGLRRRQPVHRVDRHPAGPQHIRRVQHHAQRAGDVTAHLQPRHRRRRDRAAEEHLVDRGLLETVQQVTDRLVDPGDAGDGLDTGDDAHLVCGVAGVVRLPQRVAAPPPANVFVDHRNEVHRLARGLAQLDEERGVGRV